MTYLKTPLDAKKTLNCLEKLYWQDTSLEPIRTQEQKSFHVLHWFYCKFFQIQFPLYCKILKLEYFIRTLLTHFQVQTILRDTCVHYSIKWILKY